MPSHEVQPSETSPLLQHDRTHDGQAVASHSDNEDPKETQLKLILAEFWLLLKSSIPVVASYALQNSIQTGSILIVGRISPAALSVASFSMMWSQVTAFCIALGGTTAVDTLGSAMFTASKDPRAVGLILQRAFVILTAFYIPIAILWLFSEPIFLALGQEDYIARDSAKFLRALIPGALGYIYFECVKKLLQACEIPRAGTYVLLITSPINLLLNYLFVYTFKMGLMGAPVATSLSYWLAFLLLLGYMRFVDGKQYWGGWTRQCLQLKPALTFTRLAFLGFIHIGTEWWAFEIVAIVAGQLGSLDLAAQSVIMTADQLINTIPLGIGVATSVRVGNLLGAKKSKEAARAANVAALLSVVVGGIVLLILLASRHVFALMFTSDDAVVRLTARVLPWVALFQIADGLNGSCGGSLRGMAKQHIGAAVNIVSYYCLALPLGIYLAFHGWRLPGLWIGQCIALYLVGALEYVIVFFSNWEKEVEKAYGRMDRRSSIASLVDGDV